MAITPYTQAAEAPMVSMADTFAPIPFDAMAKAGSMHQARWDKNEATQAGLDTTLESLNALSEVPIPGLAGQSVKFNDLNVLTEFKDGMRRKLDDLSKNIGDKGSPEYRGALGELLSSTKQALSPTGELGMAASNLNEMERFKKELSKNKDIATNPQLLVPYIQRLQEHNELSKDGQIHRLDLSGGIGEKVDSTKKLSDILTKVGSVVLGESGMQKYGNDFAGLYRAVLDTGRSAEDVSQMAYELMQQDGEMTLDFQRQSEYRGLSGQQEATPEELMAQKASTMGDIFSKQSRKVDYRVDQSEVNALNKSAKDKEELIGLYSRPVVLPSKGSGIKDINALDIAKDESKNTTKIAVQNLNDFANERGISKDMGGKYNFKVEDGEGGFIDYSSEAKLYQNAIEAASRKEIGLSQMENQLKEEAGFTKAYKNTPEYIERFNEKKETTLHAQFKIMSALGMRDKTYDEFVRSLSPAHVTKLVEDAMSNTDPRLIKYKELLKKSDEEGTFVAGVTPVTKSLETTMVSDFDKFFHSSDKATESIIDVDENEEVNSNDYTDTGKPDFLGWYLDDNDGGMPKLLYNMRDQNGEFQKRVKTAPPRGFISDLVTSGKVDDAKLIVNAMLTNDLGALGPKLKSDVITLEYGPKGKSTYPIKVEDMDANGMYTLTINASDDNNANVEIPKKYKSKDDLINAITEIQMQLHINSLK